MIGMSERKPRGENDVAIPRMFFDVIDDRSVAALSRVGLFWMIEVDRLNADCLAKRMVFCATGDCRLALGREPGFSIPRRRC
ncbi:MAG TPA: hypothetical protein VGU02_11110 [Gaiellaceae bacterium]|nr:hypothetical protein [Gaiellaceae bacterium]